MNIEVYLNQLCSTLQVDPLHRDEIRLEVHTHLRQRADALVREGMDAEAAEHRATAEFGETEEVAARLSRAGGSIRRHSHTRHVERVGAVFGAYGLVYLVALLLGFHSYTLEEMMRSAMGVGTVLIPVLLFVAHLLLGLALVRRRQWARSAVIILGIFYLSLFLFQLSRGVNIADSLTMVTLMSFFPGAAVGAYALWVFLHPNRRGIAWT